MKGTIIIFLVLISISLAIYFRVVYVDREARKEHSQKQIGTYVLDVNKTALGLYRKDVIIYEKLTLTFNEDYTFNFNMKVPFIYDSIGTWTSSGSSIDEWNNLYYKSWDYSNGATGEQFTQCCDGDTTFYINSATPKKGEKNIQKIYFRKLNSQLNNLSH